LNIIIHSADIVVIQPMSTVKHFLSLKYAASMASQSGPEIITRVFQITEDR